jgi:hypothetical protein
MQPQSNQAIKVSQRDNSMAAYNDARNKIYNDTVEDIDDSSEEEKSHILDKRKILTNNYVKDRSPTQNVSKTFIDSSSVSANQSICKPPIIKKA